MDFAIPKRYRIAGVDHRVRLVKNLSAEEGFRGSSEHYNQTTEIDAGLPKSEQRRTLVHEALHHIDKTFATRLTERQVGCIATGMAELVHQLQPEKRGKK